MTIVYRETDPISARWTANSGGIDLSAFQVDQNFYEAISRIATLEANETLTVSIASITIIGDALTFHMTDLTTQGPFTIPVATFNDRGSWQPFTVYNVNDTFNINGTLYLVPFAHTSAATFSAGANDGAGHNYYSALVTVPGSALPTGGATHAALRKSTGADFAVSWGFQPASETPFSPSTGSTLASGFVDEALEELEGRVSATSLAALTDVHFNTAGPTTGEIISFNGTKWANVAISVTFAEISDIVLTSAAAGDLLSFDGTHWINVAQSLLSVAFSQVTGAASAVQLRDATVTALGTTGTVSLDPTLGDVFTITPTGNVTLNAASAPAGAKITVIVTTSGTSSFNITPTTNFKSTGALATGTVTAKTFSISFVGNGTNLVEVGRTAAM